MLAGEKSAGLRGAAGCNKRLFGAVRTEPGFPGRWRKLLGGVGWPPPPPPGIFVSDPPGSPQRGCEILPYV